MKINFMVSNPSRKHVYCRTALTLFILLLVLQACADQLPNITSSDLVEIEQYSNRVNVDKAGKMDFTLIQGDYKNNGARAMMREKLPTRLNKNEWVYYKFGVDISQGWPVDKKLDALIVQWRNGWGRPLFSVHLIGDSFYIKRSEKPVKKFEYKANINEINEFLINAKWSESENGRLIVSINSEIIVDYTGPTLKPTGKKPHVAFGLYRPQWNKKKFNPDNQISIIFTHFDFGRLNDLNKAYRLTPEKH